MPETATSSHILAFLTPKIQNWSFAVSLLYQFQSQQITKAVKTQAKVWQRRHKKGICGDDNNKMAMLVCNHSAVLFLICTILCPASGCGSGKQSFISQTIKTNDNVSLGAMMSFPQQAVVSGLLNQTLGKEQNSSQCPTSMMQSTGVLTATRKER